MEKKDVKQDDNVLNRYEAVLVAAKLARKINALRTAAKEQLTPEELAGMDRRKVTSIALEELNGGKVQYERKEVVEEESTFDLT